MLGADLMSCGYGRWQAGVEVGRKILIWRRGYSSDGAYYSVLGVEGSNVLGQFSFGVTFWAMISVSTLTQILIVYKPEFK